MTKQAKKSKQKSYGLPGNIQKLLEEFFGPVTSAKYCGKFVTESGEKFPTFAVNETYYVYIHDEKEADFHCELISYRIERQREFRKQVKGLMNKYGFTWKLGKVIVNLYPIESTACVNLCHIIKEAKEWIESNKMSEEFMFNTVILFNIQCYLNTHEYYVYKALKDYWFATN